MWAGEGLLLYKISSQAPFKFKERIKGLRLIYTLLKFIEEYI